MLILNINPRVLGFIVKYVIRGRRFLQTIGFFIRWALARCRDPGLPLKQSSVPKTRRSLKQLRDVSGTAGDILCTLEEGIGIV